MKNPKPFLSLAAIASSVLLAATFVAYRGGAFNSPANSGERRNEPGRQSNVDAQQPQATMPGSKTMVLVDSTVSVPSTNKPAGSSSSHVIMGGSKYGPIIHYPYLEDPLLQGFLPAPPYEKAPEKPPAIIYGPKSAPIFREK